MQSLHGNRNSLGENVNWKEISEILKPGFKIGLLSWHKSSFWPINDKGDVLIGDLNKFNPELFNTQNWVVLIDDPSSLKNIFNDDCYDRLDQLNDIYAEIVKKLEWFIGPGKVLRNPALLQNFETYVIDQLKKIEKLKGADR